MRTSITYNRIWKVAYPIIIGLVAQNLMVVIDTAFLGRLGEVTLGAAAIGGIFYLTLFMFGAGFSVGTQIMIGRRNGERKLRHIGRISDHAMYMLLVLAAAVFMLITFVAPGFLSWFMSSEDVLAESLIFLQHRRFGIFFGFLILGFHALYIGTTRTMVLSISTILMAVVNITLDYIFIFGHLGFPAMGIAGAALATNIAELVTFAFFLIWSAKTNIIKQYRLFRFWRPHPRLYKPLFRLAFPVMFQYFFSFAAWFAFFLVIEQIGETALAASNITRSFYMLLMIPVWGLSSATNTLVSNTIGAGKSDEVISLIWKIVMIGLAASVLFIIPTIAFASEIVSFFTYDPHLIAATTPLLYVICLSLIAFSFGMIFFSGLSGTGKTMLALRLELISIGLYLVSAFILAIGFKASTAWVWSAEIVYFSVMAILASTFLYKGSWKHFEV